MFLRLETFDDVVGALRRAGGRISGELVLPDERVVKWVKLGPGEIDPPIEVEIREEVTPIREATPEEQLRRLSGRSLG
jgi:hypothetical protein